MSNGFSRRDVLQLTAATIGIASVPLFSKRALSATTPMRLRGAGYRFPRTEALFTGAVNPPGIELQFEEAGIGDINSNLFSGEQTWDVCEIGLHPFMLAYDRGFREYSLIPAYPLRVFRHKSIFIRNDRGIRRPQDLKGKRIATPGYSSTSLTWIRGILQDEYGVKPTDIEWVTSRKDSSADVAGNASAQESMVADGISMTQGPVGMDESELLVAGEVDALFHAAVPRAFVEGHPKVARLFADSRAAEQDYYRKTGIFPIMHAVAVRKSLLAEHEGLSASIFGAYSQAKQMAYRQMAGIGWAADMLPWYGQEMEATIDLMGDNFYSYGLPGNRNALDTLFRYSHEQGLASRRLTVEELFHPSALALTEQSG